VETKQEKNEMKEGWDMNPYEFDLNDPDLIKKSMDFEINLMILCFFYTSSFFTWYFSFVDLFTLISVFFASTLIFCFAVK